MRPSKTNSRMRPLVRLIYLEMLAYDMWPGIVQRVMLLVRNYVLVFPLWMNVTVR